MNDPESFLSRWSRRKRGAPDAKPEAVEGDSSAHSPPRWRAIASGQRGNLTDVAPDTRPEPGSSARQSGSPETPALGPRFRGDERDVSAGADAPKSAEEKPREPEFDLSKLPSLESITAETDIRAFLAPGIPAELTRAALRRAWVIDPKIRNFIEVAENQWDFTAAGVPGFDLSSPTGDIKQLLAQILPKSATDELRAEEGVKEPEPATSSSESPSHRNVTDASLEGHQSHEPEQEKIAQRDPAISVENSETGNAAPQKISALQDEHQTPKRGHGGAMPR